MRKYPALSFFMLRQLKTNHFLRNGALLNMAILNNFAKFTEKDHCQSFFLKHPATLKEDSGTSAFLSILKFFKRTSFAKRKKFLGKYSKSTTRMLVQ